MLDTLLSVEDPAKVLFWRDHQQREVDFVVPRGREAVDAYECKWSAAASRAGQPPGLPAGLP